MGETFSDYCKKIERIVERTQRTALRRQTLLREDRSRSARALQDLMAVEPMARTGWLEAERKRFAPLDLAEMLLATALAAAPTEPAEALELLALAMQAAEQSLLGPMGLFDRRLRFDLKARLYGARANTHRILGAYAKAKLDFCQARTYFADSLRDAGTLGQLLSFRASLHTDLCELETALECATTAAYAYGSVGMRHEAGRSMMQQANAQWQMDEPATARGTMLLAVEEFLDFEREPSLEMPCYYNLALYTAEAGDPDEALCLVAPFPAYDLPSGRLRYRAQWIQGIILAARGALAEAVACLREAREGYRFLGAAHQYCAASLDLAAVLYDDHRDDQVQELAVECLEHLSSLGVPRDAEKAFLVFLRSAARRTATIETVKTVKAQLASAALWRRRTGAGAGA